jgi:hypothetical protein
MKDRQAEFRFSRPLATPEVSGADYHVNRIEASSGEDSIASARDRPSCPRRGEKADDGDKIGGDQEEFPVGAARYRPDDVRLARLSQIEHGLFVE